MCTADGKDCPSLADVLPVDGFNEENVRLYFYN